MMDTCGSEHPWKVIYCAPLGYGCEEAVRWCPKCGGVVVDRDCDHRT